MAAPSFDTARHDVWFADGNSGSYVVHLTNGVWKAPLAAGLGSGHRWT